ncbi:MAG: hypothetical protein Q9170_007554 [Blastenia crenularia]
MASGTTAHEYVLGRNYLASARIWMTDLAQKMPNCTFHGFDIDLAQAPPREWLPPNVKLDVLDLFKPLPEEYIGKFE